MTDIEGLVRCGRGEQRLEAKLPENGDILGIF